MTLFGFVPSGQFDELHANANSWLIDWPWAVVERQSNTNNGEYTFHRRFLIPLALDFLPQDGSRRRSAGGLIAIPLNVLPDRHQRFCKIFVNLFSNDL